MLQMMLVITLNLVVSVVGDARDLSLKENFIMFTGKALGFLYKNTQVASITDNTHDVSIRSQVSQLSAQQTLIMAFTGNRS